jgi:sulfur-oxidizing protein SoxY
MKRRHFVKNTLVAGVAASFASSQLWAEESAKPTEAKAASEAASTTADAGSTSAFDAENVADTLKALGAEKAETSDKITLGAPDVAENGAVVPITIETTLENVTEMSIIAENNVRPLSASFELSPEIAGLVATRIRMGKSGKVIVLVTAGDKIYTSERQVKVTAGGC